MRECRALNCRICCLPLICCSATARAQTPPGQCGTLFKGLHGGPPRSNLKARQLGTEKARVTVEHRSLPRSSHTACKTLGTSWRPLSPEVSCINQLAAGWLGWALWIISGVFDGCSRQGCRRAPAGLCETHVSLSGY